MRGGASEASTRGGRGRPGPMAAPTVNPGHRRGAVRTPVAARIREAAAELFARQGFRGTGLRQVAAAAGVAVGTVYAHYRDKAALLRSVAEEQAAVIGRRLAPVHLTPGRPAAERWAAFRDVLRDALPWLACEAEAGAAGALDRACSSGALSDQPAQPHRPRDRRPDPPLRARSPGLDAAR